MVEDISVEKSILAAMLLDAECLETGLFELTESDFTRDLHKQIFGIMKRLADANVTVDLATVGAEMQDCMELIGIAQTQYMASNMYTYIQLMHDERKRTTFIHGMAEAVAMATDSNDSYMDYAQSTLDTVKNIGGDNLASINDAVAEALAEMGNTEAEAGLPTGFAGIERLTGGIPRGSLVVLGARPSMGKTSLAVNIATNAATDGAVVAVFELEMSKSQVLSRMILSSSLVTVWDIRSKDRAVSENACKEALKAGQAIAKMPLLVDDRSSMTVEYIRSQAYKLKRKHGKLDWVIIDYIGLIRPSSRKNVREQEIAEISRQCKLMARDLDCGVLLLSQLNRGLEAREDKRPRLSDLRESGSLEQDADAVMFLYRPAVYSQAEDATVAELIVAKNRYGAIGTIDLSWEARYFRFMDSIQE